MSGRTQPLSTNSAFPMTRSGPASVVTEGGHGFSSHSTFNSTLSSSLLSDLRRFSDEPGHTDILAVLAACVRHARPLALHIQHDACSAVLSVFPQDQLFQCIIDLQALPERALAALRLLHVEPEHRMRHSVASVHPMPAGRAARLAPLLWRLAMFGATNELLPEIAGPGRYRISPGLSIDGLPIDPQVLSMLRHLRTRPASLDELAALSDGGRVWVRRLLNALYLQSGLMITRSHPTPWFGRSSRALR